ncbi:hypothetical protein H4Q26_011470 [Puccinia striiformis f. sp. tritici PST-130]|nr:hypothetical protein H4Q26_011470 [Puccinia striiformis f. sp. tritici PST-130]
MDGIYFYQRREHNKFNEINQLPQQAKSKAYSELLRSLFEPPRTDESVRSISQFVSNIVQDLIGLLISKTVLSELVSLIDTELNGADQIDFKRNLLESILEQPDLSGRTVRFEEQISSLRESLASLLEAQEDWSEAAKALQGIPLDGTHRNVSQDYRLNTYIRIVRLLLEDDNATNAESYLNRASLLIPESKDEATILAFKLSQARILDSKRKFEEATAVVCGVLAPAGPNRTRLLTSLFRDERSVNLSDYKILSKMVLGQIIKDHEMVEFEKRLKPHQLAKLPKILAPQSTKLKKLITFKNSIDPSEDDVVVSNVAIAAIDNPNHISSEKDQLVAIAPSLSFGMNPLKSLYKKSNLFINIYTK